MGDLEALIAYHKPGVEMYRKFWEEISGEKVKEAGLYFTDTKQRVVLGDQALFPPCFGMLKHQNQFGLPAQF